MQVDWRQIATHIVGFLIALLILKRYAWGPVLKLLEERREKIRGEFDRIETEKKSAAALRSDYEGQLRGIDALSRAKVQESVHEGQRVAGEIQEQARVEARAQVERARAEIELERDKASVALRDDMADMVVRATERLVREKLDDAKHRQLVQEFIAALDTLQGGEGSAQ